MYGFSDISPGVELAIFFAVFAGAWLVTRQERIGAAVTLVLHKLSSFVRRKLFVADDVETEQRRLDLIRIVFGVMALMRNFWDLVTAIDLGSPAVMAVTAAATLLSLLLTIGLAAPLAAFALGVLINIVFDNISDTSTLASLIAAMCCMSLAFAPAGRSLSADALILRSGTRWGAAWRSLYAWIGPMTLDRAAIAKFALALAYGGISLSSALLHLQTENWLNGMTNAWVFINPVMSPEHYPIALEFYEWSPRLYVLFVNATIYGTLVFQLGFVPLLLLDRWTQRLVMVLEMGFVFGSIFVLALHWLGWFQLAMCLILFWNRFKLNIGRTETVGVFYDEEARPCARAVRLVSALDLFNIVEPRPFSRDLERPGERPLPPGARRAGLLAVDREGRPHEGYDGLLLLAGRVFLLLPVWPVLALGKVLGIGPKLAAFLAVGRPRGAERSVRPSRPAGNVTQDAPVPAHGFNPLVRAFAVTFVVMFCAFAARLPVGKYVPALAAAGESSKRVLGAAPLAFGLMQIDAFNFPPLSGVLPTFEVSWSKDGQRRFLFTIPASRAGIRVSDMLFYQVQTTFNQLRFDGTCFAREFGNTLLNRLALRALLRRAEYQGGEFHIRMKAYTVPEAADFKARRFAPLRWYDVCEASFPAGDVSRVAFEYFQQGIDVLAVRSPLPFSFSVETIPLARNYPCRAEAQRIAYWFDHPQLADRDPRALERVRQFMQTAQTASGLTCLMDGLGATQMVYTNWRPEQPPPPGADCEADLVSARAMLGTGLADLRPGSREWLEQAEAARTRGDDVACLLQTAAIRRSYYDAVTSRASAAYRPG